ncbi:MAG: hypothetical protein ABL956_13820 [Hyphomonadaceae bacterium]
MGHFVNLVVGDEASTTEFLAQWPGARAVSLLGGWRAIPLDERLCGSIAERYPEVIRSSTFEVTPYWNPDLPPRGIQEALAAATKRNGRLAYVETAFHGGTGSQSAAAYIDGEEVMQPTIACVGEEMTDLPDGLRHGIAPPHISSDGFPINQALRLIGVVADGDCDEFDTIELGKRRATSDY